MEPETNDQEPRNAIIQGLKVIIRSQDKEQCKARQIDNIKP